MSKKRVRRTKEQIAADNAKKEAKKVEGLGDVVEKITEATGIKKLVTFIAGEDCGCEERKEKLNKLFKFSRTPECLEEKEYQFLNKLYMSNKMSLTATEQVTIINIYNRVMRKDKRPSSCNSCYKSVYNELRKVYDAYTPSEL